MLEIGDDSAGQRIDNFLLRTYKGVPKSHIYRILRSGEVRVNKGRIGPAYRLVAGDIVRVPPINSAHKCDHFAATWSTHFSAPSLPAILYEDDHLIALDKPAGVAVHGGSGISLGVIEQLRQVRQGHRQARFLELVHRLDRSTSGILLIAKKRAALVNLHAQIRNNQIDKRYLVCVHADWRERQRIVQMPLHKYLTPTGERRVCVHANGQAAHTVFNLVRRFNGYALLEAELKTGRTHQIRVHLAYLNAPIVGDDKYGDFSLNRKLAQAGAQPKFKRMFLHAFKLCFIHPATGLPLTLTAPLPDECQHFLNALNKGIKGIKGIHNV